MFSAALTQGTSGGQGHPEAFLGSAIQRLSEMASSRNHPPRDRTRDPEPRQPPPQAWFLPEHRTPPKGSDRGKGLGSGRPELTPLTSGMDPGRVLASVPSSHFVGD